MPDPVPKKLIEGMEPAFGDGLRASEQIPVRGLPERTSLEKNLFLL
jgi:hypothetical protein